MTLSENIETLAEEVGTQVSELRKIWGTTSTTMQMEDGVASGTIPIVKDAFGVVSIAGNVTLANSLAENTSVRIGLVPAGFRPPSQTPGVAFMYSTTGSAGSILIAANGNVTLLHSGGSRASASISATYRT